MTVRILVSESVGFSSKALTLLEELGSVVKRDLDQAQLAAAVSADQAPHVVFVRLRNRVDEDLLSRARHLGAVVSPTTGLDHLELGACRARGVAVLSLRGEKEFLRSVAATAEHAWALLLALVRHIPAASAAAAGGRWDRDLFRGRELRGKTLGVVGLGRLGEVVARYGHAFGMRVAAFDPYRGGWPGTDGGGNGPDHGSGAAPGHRAGPLPAVPVRRVTSLRALATISDVLTLHVPLNDETRGMVDAEVLGALRDGAVLVNTSRGGIVDEAALLDALGSKRLAGAALDVVAGETRPGGGGASPLVDYARAHRNLLLTPHIGGATVESMESTEIFMAQKLARWLRGEPVRVDAGPPSAPSDLLL